MQELAWFCFLAYDIVKNKLRSGFVFFFLSFTSNVIQIDF